MLRSYMVALAAVATLSTAALANVTATGKVFYKMPGGELIKRDATLTVPSRGQGKVVLRSGNNIKMESTRFRSISANGRTVFQVMFVNPPGAPENTASVFSGTYTRGRNAAVYFGDFFGRSWSSSDDMMNAIGDFGQDAESEAIMSAFGPTDDAWQWAGGFGFKAMTAAPEQN